jgi:acyl-CoA thioester hydrolase
MPEPAFPFSLPLGVRDYECDLQGIVNNAVYQNYFEHARHEFLRSRGVDFAALHAEGLDPVVYRIEIDYKEPLRSGDRFSVRLRVELEGRLKLVFHQEAIKEPSGALAARARVVAVMTRAGRPLPASDAMLAAIL